MKRIFAIAAAIAVAASLSVGMASAAVNVKSLPTATFSGDTVTLTGGNFSGLGSTPAVATVTVNGTATYQCNNPGSNQPPGQQTVGATPGTASQDTGNSQHNGRGTIENLSASVSEPNPPPTTRSASCGGQGSSGWSLQLLSLTATSAHLVITEAGTQVFCRDYTLNGPSTGTAC